MGPFSLKVQSMPQLAGRNITKQEFIGIIRNFMRDHAHLNALIEGVETGNFMISMAIDLAIDNFNTSPPFIGNQTFESFPSLEMLLYGALVRIFEMNGLLQTRNRLNYVDGGLQVAESDKGPDYERWVNRFEAKFEREKMRWKRSTNLESCYGGVHSEYLLAGAYGAYGVGSFEDLGSFASITTTLG